MPESHLWLADDVTSSPAVLFLRVTLFSPLFLPSSLFDIILSFCSHRHLPSHPPSHRSRRPGVVFSDCWLFDRASPTLSNAYPSSLNLDKSSVSGMFFATLALSLLSTTWAAPGLVYPLQDQLPPVARVGSAFIFDLLPGTFNSTSSISYTTSALPSWLSWDSPTLAFYGTPASSDQGQEDITVTATDSSGSTRSSFTLLVTNYSVPGVHQSFYTQIRQPNLHDISSATILPEGTGVSIPPWWSFSLGFQPDTFRLSNDDNNNGRLYNDARVRGTAGLPSWLHFDNETFTFSGVAPGEGTYTIVATGTDFWGYTGAQTSFIIEIGQGESIELARDYNFTDVQTIAKGKVDYALDLNGILVGNETATKDELNITLSSDEYDWLSFNR